MEKTNLLKMTSQEMRMMRRLLKNAQKWQINCPEDESRHVDFCRQSSEGTKWCDMTCTKFGIDAKIEARFSYTVFTNHILVEINREDVCDDPEQAFAKFLAL